MYWKYYGLIVMIVKCRIYWLYNLFNGLKFNHATGYEAALQTPQVLPFLSLMKPDSPHPVPQEFLIFHDSELAPTKRTPWSSEVPQFENIPLL